MTSYVGKIGTCLVYSYTPGMIEEYLDEQGIKGKENIKLTEAVPEFDNLIPDVVVADYIQIEAGGRKLRFPVCDTSSLLFQLNVARKSSKGHMITSYGTVLFCSSEEAELLYQAINSNPIYKEQETAWLIEHESKTRQYFDLRAKAVNLVYGKA